MNLLVSLLLLGTSGALLMLLVTLIPQGSVAFENNKIVLLIEITAVVITLIIGLVSFVRELKKYLKEKG